MSNTTLQGKVTFVNHDKNYVTIEYEAAFGKKKTINGSVDEQLQQQLKKQGLIKKIHQFHIGDVVSFVTTPPDKGGKKLAAQIQYLYNTALDVLINKAKTDNFFTGYLKLADDKYFVKEIDSYLFFPLTSSPWWVRPTERELNESVTFSLENLDKKDKITAKLTKNSYVPEYYTAQKLHQSKTVIDAKVYKISPHGIYLNVVGDKVQGKITPAETEDLKTGDTVKVRIHFLSPTKIVLERALTSK
jgi:hypothetical protein